MFTKICSVLTVIVLFSVTCYGQQSDVVFLEPQKKQQPQVEFKPMPVGREERQSFNVGVFMGGGGIVGFDLEFLLGNRVGLQFGAGLPTAGFGLNYHFKPYINSSFLSLQYNYIGFGMNNVCSTVGPMFNFRAKKIFQAGIGFGAVVSKGALWSETYKDKNVSMLFNINVGLFFPI